jgi:hypothetical protein
LGKELPLLKEKKMRKYLLSVLGVGAVIFMSAGILSAQEAETPVAEDSSTVVKEETEFSYGVVNAVDASKLVLDEYDYDTNQETSVTYAITADTKIEGVENVAGIAVGDGAEVEYATLEGNKNAKVITIEKQSLENEISEGEDIGTEEAVETKEGTAQIETETKVQ